MFYILKITNNQDTYEVLTSNKELEALLTSDTEVTDKAFEYINKYNKEELQDLLTLNNLLLLEGYYILDEELTSRVALYYHNYVTNINEIINIDESDIKNIHKLNLVNLIKYAELEDSIKHTNITLYNDIIAFIASPTDDLYEKIIDYVTDLTKDIVDYKVIINNHGE